MSVASMNYNRKRQPLLQMIKMTPRPIAQYWNLVAYLCVTYRAMIEQSRNRYAEQRATDHYNRWKVFAEEQNGGSRTVGNRQSEDLFVTSRSTTGDDVDGYVGDRWQERRISMDHTKLPPFEQETMLNEINSASPFTVPLSAPRYNLKALDDRSTRNGGYATSISAQDDSGNGSVEDGKGIDSRGRHEANTKESNTNDSDKTETHSELEQLSSNDTRAAAFQFKTTDIRNGSLLPTMLNEARYGDEIAVLQRPQQFQIPQLPAGDGSRSVGAIERSASIDSALDIGSPRNHPEVRRSSSFGGTPSVAVAEEQVRQITVGTKASFSRRRTHVRRMSSSRHSPVAMPDFGLQLSPRAVQPQPHVERSTVDDGAGARSSLFPVSTTVVPAASSPSLVDESKSVIGARDSMTSVRDAANDMESTSPNLRRNYGEGPTSNKSSISAVTNNDELLFTRVPAHAVDDAGETRDVSPQVAGPQNAELRSDSNDYERKGKIKIGRSDTDDNRLQHRRQNNNNNHHHHRRQDDDTQHPAEDQGNPKRHRQHRTKSSGARHRPRGDNDDDNNDDGGNRTTNRSSKSVRGDRRDDQRRRHRHDRHRDGDCVEDDSNDSRHQRRNRHRHRSRSGDRALSSSASRPRPEPLLSIEDWERAAEAEAAADAPVSAQVARYNAGGQV